MTVRQLLTAVAAFVVVFGITVACSGSNPTPDAGTPARKKIPTNVDCSKPENCYHLACYNDAACGSAPAPGGCPSGQVRSVKNVAGVLTAELSPDGGNLCRACTADDCDGLGGFCCNADVCQDSVECGIHYCEAIAPSCAGVSSDVCGYGDLDGDDPWGDIDEQVGDPCCFCKQAVGFEGARCGDGGMGFYVLNNKCTACTKDSCSDLPCMGLNGCPTGCDAGFFFNGAGCIDCTSNSQTAFIPACK